MDSSVSEFIGQETARIHRIIDSRIPITHEGVVMDGSYNADQHTLDFKLGDTEAAAAEAGQNAAANGGGSFDSPLGVEGAVTIVGPYGDFYAPRGGERAIIIPSRGGGYNAFLHHGSGDGNPQARNDALKKTSGIQPGDRWLTHFNNADPQNPKPDSIIKLIGDGTPGDGKGGILVEAAGRHTIRTTRGVVHEIDDTGNFVSTTDASGFGSTIDFSAKKVMHGVGVAAVSQVAVGTETNSSVTAPMVPTSIATIVDGTGKIISHVAVNAKTIMDGVNNQISHVAGTVGLGDLASNLATNPVTAALNQSHLTTFEGSMFPQRLTDIKNIATAMLTAMSTSGVPSLPSAAAVFAQIASMAHIPIPAGSQVVRIIS
jgi:hypothetical protein